MTMQISAVTLGVKDLECSKKFYGDGLGCPIDQDHPGFVSFNLGEGAAKLSLYTWDALAADAGVPADPTSGFRGVMFSYIVESQERVTEVMAQAERAGRRSSSRRRRPNGVDSPVTSPTPTATSGKSPATRVRRRAA